MLSDDKREFNLRIRYEYIKPKDFWEFGGIFDDSKLKVKIGSTSFTIDKNATKDVRVKAGELSIKLDNDVKKIVRKQDIQYDTSLVVSWNVDKKRLSIREEL